MSVELQECADAAYILFEKRVSAYKFSAAGLTANAELLARADASFATTDAQGDFPIDAYLQLIRDGKPRHLAAEQVGENPEEVAKRIKFDLVFREKVVFAEEMAAEKIEERLWSLAENSERWAMELWLKKRLKPRWGDDPSVVRHEGTVTSELSAAPIVEQILALQGLLNQRAELSGGRRAIDVESREKHNES